MTTMNNEDPADPSVHEQRISDVELPEPVARIASLTNHQGDKWYALEPLVSYPLKINARVYTADQMREVIAAERALLLTDIAAMREALDEAATDCELHPLYLGDSATLDDIIRAGGDAAFVTGLARGLREARGSAAEKEQPQMTPATKRPPRKDNLARLEKLLNEWVKAESYAAVIRGSAGIGSARARRVLDAAALRDVLAYFDQP